jgi:hypothetical protein
MSPKPLTDKQRYWLTHIERCQAAEQSLTSYADAHELDIKTLYRWKSTLSKRGCFESSTVATLFTRVAVEQQGPVQATNIQIRFPNGCVLQSNATDASTLRILTTALLSVS